MKRLLRRRSKVKNWIPAFPPEADRRRNDTEEGRNDTGSRVVRDSGVAALPRMTKRRKWFRILDSLVPLTAQASQNDKGRTMDSCFRRNDTEEGGNDMEKRWTDKKKGYKG